MSEKPQTSQSNMGAVSGSYSDIDANTLLMLYDELIREQTKKPKSFKRTIELENVYKEVFKRVWEYDR